jgi:hypothetical protein
VDDAEWWAIRRAQSLKPATYRCPLCGEQLHAMSEHVLIAPEGDASRRRHAHSACVQSAIAIGRIRTYDDWRKAAKPGFARLRTLRQRLNPRKS